MFKEFIDNLHAALNNAKRDDDASKFYGAVNGQRFVDLPNPDVDPLIRQFDAENQPPLSYNDIQRIMPYKEFFDMNMDVYAKEADPEKRIQLLDFMGTKTALGTLPGTARYLQIMRNTEEAVKRHGTTNYQYGETAKYFKDVLNGEIDKFGPHRA